MDNVSTENASISLAVDNQDESVEYNVLLKGVEQYGKNTATSGSESGHVHSALESMDFDEMESVMWKKHQLRRFFQDRGNWWTSSRRSTAWKWVLVTLVGVLIACMGASVQEIITLISDSKYNTLYNYTDDNRFDLAFFSFFFMSLCFAFIAGGLCWIEPAAAGSGIPEIKSYLNGVDLYDRVRIKVLFAKAIGMCFSVAAGLPLGKEGPMIHTGAIVGAAVSQGKSITFGFDTSWTKFQDLRNDRSKRDFVTYGAAAGVAAAFKAPIGGILFTLEEGASFWSTSLTFRSFFCAMITMLTISTIYNGFTFGRSVSVGIQFGEFDSAEYRTYELIFFGLMGVAGGAMGAVFNKINEKVTYFRIAHLNSKLKKISELLALTCIWTLISFIIPLCWRVCTPKPSQTAKWSSQQYDLLDELVQFQCDDDSYNEVASLFLTSSDTAMQQLFHYLETNGNHYSTFSTGSLLLFFFPYFIVAAYTSGTFCPAGLFVPTILAGAAFGRLIGLILGAAFPGYVTNPGTYALMGAAAILGGMARMTIAGAVIMLEACGSTSYLLPLMLTFAAARYTGNAINHPMYDMQIHIRKYPFLEGSLKSIGLLNYNDTTDIMAKPVITIESVAKVGIVYDILKNTKHNGYPVTTRDGVLIGFIPRKVLCSLLKHKVFSVPRVGVKNESGEVQLAPAATLFHGTIERNYPRYPKIEDIRLTSQELNFWLDVRPYMDSAPYSIDETSSISRCYRYFRTMGLRHLIVINKEHKVTGIITRHDLTEHALEHHWAKEGDNLQKVNVGNVDPAFVRDYDLPTKDTRTSASPGDSATNGRQFSPIGVPMASFPPSSSDDYSQQKLSTNPSPSSSVGSYVAPSVSRKLKEPKSMKAST